ncbi:hypothetical protein AMTRI_Chr01g109920 [Amborella trichopoda]
MREKPCNNLVHLLLTQILQTCSKLLFLLKTHLSFIWWVASMDPASLSFGVCLFSTAFQFLAKLLVFVLETYQKRNSGEPPQQPFASLPHTLLKAGFHISSKKPRSCSTHIIALGVIC